jgi:monoamine oxidase
VIGAGAAGLAAALHLSRAGRRVLVLEARTRTGGRIHTLHQRDWPIPVELGAEFLHGDAAAAREVVDAAGLAVLELEERHLLSANGRLADTRGFWQRFAGLQRRMRALHGDVAFDAFLARQKGLASTDRQMAIGYVEGFFAARLDRISARSLASDDEGPDSSQGRLRDGYDGLVRALEGGLDPGRVEVRTNTIVTDVEWRAGRVRVRSRSGVRGALPAAFAPHLVVTVPLGVLKAPDGVPGAIRFSPGLREKARALARLEMGSARRVVLRFREDFWTRAGFTSFVHAPDEAFPTWWTGAPAEVRCLTAWAGGAPAEALAGQPPAVVARRAVEVLARLSKRPLARILPGLEAWETHDWDTDPFSRGAYAYIGVGGMRAAALLARPVARTLFFAGEATEGDEIGTVSGAVASGRRAARQVLGGRAG